MSAGQESPLTMLHLDLDAAHLARRGRHHGSKLDLGYAVHQHLAGLFGPRAIQPFRIVQEHARRIPVLGYSRSSAQELRDHAATFSDPRDYATIDWSAFAGKAMPDLWHSGRRLGFELMSTPVVRLSKEIHVTLDGEPRVYSQGAELDAWVHERWIKGEERSREEVYTGWLRARLDGAAQVERSRLVSFRRREVLRRRVSAERTGKVVETPEALFDGVLQVADGLRFARLLADGVGRHRAFGFGMLLLKPPS